MKYNYEFDMKHTDNPYIDLIVNCVKILGMNAIVKNENEALHYEDTRSASAAAKYIKFKEGAWDPIKDGNYFEDMYMEWNSYYRMLNGLPPAYTMKEEKDYLAETGSGDEVYDDIGCAHVIPELYKRYFIDMSNYEVPEDMPTLILDGKYLHELSMEDLAMVDSCGILDQIKAEYSDDVHYQYIYHLGDKRVSFYDARRAPNFSLLWLPELNTFDIIENKFKRVFDRNRKYTISTVYSEAYRFMSYHYDAFILILIIIQTMVDMISEVQEYIINKDVFDSRTIRYLFESYGIAYYKEIPTKYQIRIIKNVNNLLKYKSSNKNITDILGLFDDDSIVVYTYYLMKTKALNRDNFYFYTEKDVNPKYNTNRDYYIGNPKDISNNKLPLTNVRYNEPDYEFINKYVFGFDLNENNAKILNNNQPVAKLIANDLISVSTDTSISNSFVEGFLNNIAVLPNQQSKDDDRGSGWFNIYKYVVNDDIRNTKYLVERNNFLIKLRQAIADKIKYEFELMSEDERFGINQYWYRKIKYKLLSILGIFDFTEYDENLSDVELDEYFYRPETQLTDRYRKTYHLENKYLGNDVDNFMLNHTIPFMTWYEYKGDVNGQPYIFNTTETFSVTPERYVDLYSIFTEKFRRSYFDYVKLSINELFDDLAVDEINNPTPRYIGWIDLTYAVSQLHMTLDEITIGEKVTTIDEPNIPIYNTAYFEDIVTEDMIGQEYFTKNYDLCFLKVPILDPNAHKVLERNDLRRSYDAITLADPFWDGVSTFDILTDEERAKLHLSKKKEILNKEFTIERTKYIAVEASIDLTKAAYQICYFMNMLYDSHKDEEDLYVKVDKIISDNKVRLNDLLTFAIALNYIYNGVEPDNIASDMEKNMYINGFNFDTDWTDIYNYLENKHFINNNYLNEIHTYSYVNEFGETITNTGYGMDPMRKGYLSELYEDFIIYKIEADGTEIKAYLGNPIYGYNEDGSPKYNDPESDTKYTNEPINMRELKDPDTLMPNPQIGAFLSGRYEQCADDCITTDKFSIDFGSSDIWNYNLENHVKYNWTTGEFSTIDISWKPTQYPSDDNNSHGLWLDTEILTRLDSATSDLEKINMLKKIYYSNTNLYNHLTYMMRTAQSKRMHDIYKILFESFMETKMNHKYYTLVDANGNYVYTDTNDPGSTYNIIETSKATVDSEGFPVFLGTKISDSFTQKYYFKHNEDFTDCKYIGENGEVIDCLINEYKYINYGIKEYVAFEDSTGELEHYYMSPELLDGYIFVIEYIDYYYLQNKNNPDILIPIELDDEGKIKDEDKLKDIELPQYDDNGKPLPPIKIDIERKVASTYYEFLQYRNPFLYAHLIDLKYNYKNIDDKRVKIEALCEAIAISLEKYFDSKEWRFIFNLLPTYNIQNIQRYIMKVVIFFKSWKTQILDTAVNYIIDDPFNNHVHILDDLYYNTTFDNLLEKIRPKDYKEFHNYTEYRDPVDIREKINMETVIFEPYTIEIKFSEKIYGHNFDYPSFTSKLNLKDNVSIGEKVEFSYVDYTGEIKIDSNGNYLLP